MMKLVSIPLQKEKRGYKDGREMLSKIRAWNYDLSPNKSERGYGKYSLDKTAKKAKGTLYVGDVGANKTSTRREFKYTHILHCSKTFRKRLEEDKDTKELTLTGLTDAENLNIIPYLRTAFEFLDSAFKSREDPVVLVHCLSGKSRSCAVAIGYLMYKKGWSFKKALAGVQMDRMSCAPSRSFTQQLKIMGMAGNVLDKEVEVAVDEWISGNV